MRIRILWLPLGLDLNHPARASRERRATMSSFSAG
jgi:hypothetical protein